MKGSDACIDEIDLSRCTVIGQNENGDVLRYVADGHRRKC